MPDQRNCYPMDNSAILYLSQTEPNHTNSYRFTMTMADPVCPHTLQKAADRIYSRFPTIFAGFCAGIFDCQVVPAPAAPRIMEDPGLLRTMSAEEIRTCAYRIFYRENQIIIEAFHALTDGYGAMASLRTLTAEYLHIRYGLDLPERGDVTEKGESEGDSELSDAYLIYDRFTPSRPKNRASCQLTEVKRDWDVKLTRRHYSTDALLAAARRYGVSMTAMVSCLMAESIMERQTLTCKTGKEKPVRIMVPVDLRRIFPSHTLRNFILYALPTMEFGDVQLSREERMGKFRDQLQTHMSQNYLGGQISANAAAQRLWIYRILPWKMKRGMMKLAYRYFGEINSSITLTNLGNVPLSEEMKKHVLGVDVVLTPRRRCPYNCSLITLGNVTSVSVSRFCETEALADCFFSKLDSLVL